jgi:predicted  nucleic acid-binding Zn-ribbon protein
MMNQMRSDLDNLQNNFEDLRKELLSLKEEVSRQG